VIPFLQILIPTLGVILVGWWNRTAVREHGMANKREIIHEIGTLKIEIDGNLKNQIAEIKTAAFAAGRKFEKDETKP
jgi:hypothetical protein